LHGASPKIIFAKRLLERGKNCCDPYHF